MGHLICVIGGLAGSLACWRQHGCVFVACAGQGECGCDGGGGECRCVGRSRITTTSGLGVKQYKHDLYIWRVAVRRLARAEKGALSFRSTGFGMINKKSPLLSVMVVRAHGQGKLISPSLGLPGVCKIGSASCRARVLRLVKLAVCVGTFA